jgi:ribosome-interacting GTPase 1
MMSVEGIDLQLVDLPPLAEEHVDPWVVDLVRGADLIWIVVTVENALDGLEGMRKILGDRHQSLKLPRDGTREYNEDGWIHTPGLIVVTSMDVDGAAEDLEIFRALLEEPWPVHPVCAPKGEGLDVLRRATFEAMRLIRVYCKQPGKEADLSAPFALPIGGTVEDLAATIHRDVVEGFKFALVWGAKVFDGQTVGREHVLEDGDVVEIHH